MLETLTKIILSGIESGGYTAVAVLMALESANIPIPSEIIMPFAGFLVARDALSFWPVVLWGTAGNLIGTLISYGIALRFHDSGLLMRLFFLNPADIANGERWFRKFGSVTAFVSRLLPIVRTFISFPAGMFRVPFVPFSLFTLAGSFLWSLFLTYAGVTLGANWHNLEIYFRKFQYGIAAVIVIGGAYWIYRHVRNSKS